MSDTLISQQLSLPMMPDNQLSQMKPAVSRADLSMPNVSEGSMDPLSSTPTINHVPLSSMEHDHLDYNPTSNNSMGQEMLASYNMNGQSDSTPNNKSTSREAVQTQPMRPNSVVSNALMSNKRKATTELIPDNRNTERMSAPNRRAPQVSNLVKPSGVTGSSMVNSPTSGTPGRKVVQLESVKHKSQSTVSKKNAQPQAPSKPSTESNDSVRVKLRESLASALALVSQQRESPSDGKMKVEKDDKTQVEKGVGEQPLVSASSNGTANLEAGKAEESCASTTSLPTDGGNCINSTPQGIHQKETSEEVTNETWNYIGPGFPSNAVLSGENVSFGDGFFFKDELLQGNGLTWEMELPHDPEARKIEHVENPVMLTDVAANGEERQTTPSPEAVAFEIEAELFKLFGGVNKKYKEKGRSLLFNLKDRNNPELRERVMSGEITPERLCSMTAEELASKELSEWRIAKAEELAQMIVLPDDSEANKRRLVKKTHKGEYTVDLDPNVDAAEEIPSGASASLQNGSRTKSASAGTPRKSGKNKGDQDNQCEITIPGDGADMQGLMVEDVKDLPPIVSLDEFMESLDKEPPFENLSENPSGGSNHESEEHRLNREPKKEELEPGSESMSPVKPSNRHVETTLHKTDDIVDSKKQHDHIKSTDTKKGLDTKTVVRYPKGDQMWEGLVQISLSSMASFVAFYTSGERASTKEWPGFFDIKGRVKLDAFDKFVQALPMSRSRAIMVTHFMLKEESNEKEHADLHEVIDSYIMDQRLGFAEPAPGVELYLCPPRSKSVDVILTHLSKSYTEKLKDIDNGLIGLLVWRKVQITPPPPTTISPNSSSLHHNDMTKRNPFSPSGTETDVRNRNYGFATRRDHPPPPLSRPQPPVHDDDDADVPPGFGPPGQARDDDDLPEFNFGGGSNPPPTSQLPNPNPFPGPCMGPGLGARGPAGQVEQMRELIQKYGKNGNNVSSGGSGIPTQPWNDDDDDIPEWQPQAPVVVAVAPPPLPPPVHNPGMLGPHQHQFPGQQPPPAWTQPTMQPLQPPMRVAQQGTWWPYGPPLTLNTLANQPPPSGQFFGTPGGGHPSTRDRGRLNSNNNRGY